MTTLPEPVLARARETIKALIAHSATVATAESCTGGLIAGALTAIAGSSEAVYGGFVTYANDAKEQMLGVQTETLIAHGAVSEETAREMAAGARNKARTTYAIAVTGIAGPGGGTPDKPVGLVWFGLAGPDGVIVEKRLFGDIGRTQVRQATVLHALDMLLAAVGKA